MHLADAVQSLADDQLCDCMVVCMGASVHDMHAMHQVWQAGEQNNVAASAVFAQTHEATTAQAKLCLG